MKSLDLHACACALLVSLAVSPAHGGTPPMQPTSDGPRIAPPATASDAVPSVLRDSELATTRARSTVALNSQQLTAVTTGNILGDYQAGAITLSDNALSSFNGVGNFLFNTGAQNSLQTGMTLTITIEN